MSFILCLSHFFCVSLKHRILCISLIFIHFFTLDLLSSLQLQTLNTPLFPHFPSNPPIFPKNHHQLGEILQKPPLFYPKIIKNPTFYPSKPRKPTFSLKKPLKPPIFSNFPSFFIRNSGFYRHLTPAALIPYLSLFFPIFQKSSNSRLFPTFSRFLDQNLTKTPFFHQNPYFSTKTPIFPLKPRILQ